MEGIIHRITRKRALKEELDRTYLFRFQFWSQFQNIWYNRYRIDGLTIKS